MGVLLTSGGTVLRRNGATVEKAPYFDPTLWYSLADRIHSRPLLLASVGQASPIGARRLLRYDYSSVFFLLQSGNSNTFCDTDL